LGLAVLVTFKTINVWHIFVLGAITSTTWAFEQPVRQALLPQLVRREDLVNALALNAVTWNGAGLIGPSLVGLSVGWIGVDGCFYVNVVSYLAVIVALLRIHFPAQSFDRTKITVLQSLLDGIGYVRRHQGIATLLVVSAIFSVFGRSYIILMPVFAKEVLALGAAGLGYLAAAPGLGTIIGSLTLAALGSVEARGGRIFTILVGFSIALFAFAASRHVQLSFGLLVIVGALSTLFETLLQTSIQLMVEESFRGRVLGFYGLTVGGLRELGGMQAGFVAEWTGAPVAIEMGSVVLILLGGMFLANARRGKVAAAEHG
jgi:MFS family permease